ncbi:YfhO family protein [Devosia sp. SL43]|uniref:YfhO family protein n=1 Tax=Devosia sp. SL43 TaxID=2806348 RepID=UPI001F3E35F0|nr:YfhO family protein [Devosia sp. SL43]UJW85870.1 hypothetical protein IM737_00780 [Devosia sp. SL43]
MGVPGEVDSAEAVPAISIVGWTRKTIVPTAALILLVLLIIGVNPFRQTLAPMDLLLAYPGWANAGISTPLVNPERSDALDHRLPNWRYFREELRRGHMPLWNPLHQLGAPGIQAPIYEGLSIPFLIFAITPNEAVGYTLATIANFLLAAVGAYLLLLFMFESKAAAVFGALVFAFCGFNLAWTHWPHLTTSALIPWVLASQLRYWQSGKLRWVLLFAASVALMGLAGFPFVALLGAICASILGAVLFVSDLARTGPSRRLFALTISTSAAGIVGLLVALPAIMQISAILEDTDLSYRAGGTGLDASHLVNLFGLDFVNRLGVERTFSAGTIAAVLAAGACFFSVRFHNRFALFGILIGLFVLCTAYGFAPAGVVRAIPGFSNNPWSRAALLVGLVLAVLSSYLIALSQQKAKSSGINLWWAGSYVTVVAIQATQLALQFGMLNAKPPIEAYFPTTPSIKYAQDNLLPGQSVVADGSFLISGVLTNYGLPELFAHGFRTVQQLPLLADIAAEYRASPTSTNIACGGVNFSSSIPTYAAVRFFLIGEECLSMHFFETKGAGHAASIPLNLGELRGELTLDTAATVKQVQILLATYREPMSPSALTLSLYREDELVGLARLAPEAVSDNAYATFDFDGPILLSAGTFRYVLSMDRPDSSKQLSVWTFTSANGKTYRVGNQEVAGAPKLRLVSPPRTLPTQPIMSLEPGIAVIENPAVTGSAYYLSRLEGHPIANYQPVELVSFAPDDVAVRYDGAESGWIALPIRVNKDWLVTVNGQPAKIDRFLEFFPAVAVSGPSDVRFYYAPAGFLRMLLLSLCGAILFATMLIGWHLVERKSLRKAASGF